MKSNIRYLLRLIAAFLTRFKEVIVLGVLVGVAIFVIVTFILPFFLGRTIEIVGYTGRFRVEEIPQSILTDVSQGLTKIDESGLPQPGLAERWEVQDEGKQWTFYLRDNAIWQDGKNVTSENINPNLTDVVTEKPDSKTIIFKLKNPFAPFANVVSSPLFKKGLLGTGEWKVSRLTVVSGYVSKMALVNNKKERRVIKFYPTEERTKLAFKLGEVNKIIDIIDPEPLSKWKISNVQETVNTQRYIAVFFNTMHPSLNKDNKELRQALSYAINKDDIGPSRAYGPISPTSWAYNQQIKTYDYDPERSKELLKALPSEARENLSIKLSTTPLLLPIAEKIVKNWNEVGINSSVSVVSSIPSDYQAFLAIYDIPTDPDQYAIWHSTQKATNISHYENPRIDKLLEDGRLTLDVNERKKIYLDFQRFLLEDSPAAFLIHPVSYTISRK